MLRGRRIAGGFRLLAICCGLASAGAPAQDAVGTVQRTGSSFDRSSLLWDDGVDVEKAKAADRIAATGWVEYDFEVAQGGWHELRFHGMPADWARDVLVDGKLAFRHSIAMPGDEAQAASGLKEGNLYLSAGKHTLRVRRMTGPGLFPNRWELIPAAGRAEASIGIQSIERPIVAPGESFNVELVGGMPEGPVSLELFLESLIDRSTYPAGTAEFLAGQPTTKQITIAPPPDKGAYLLRAKRDGKLLDYNDLKVMPLVVAKVAGLKQYAETTPDKLALAGLFNTGAVMQRDVKLPIWGWSKPGSTVSVEFAGQSASTIADGKGAWTVTLDPIRAPGPYELKVSSGPETIRHDDILCGDVWLLSGQSNMGGTLKDSFDGHETAANEAKHPDVRLGWAAVDPSAKNAGRVTSRWQKAALLPGQDVKSLHSWNAISFAFGTHLHRKLNIPIGLVINNRGGTRIATWTSLDAQQREPAFELELRRWAMDSADRGIEFAAASAVPGMIRSIRNKQGPDAPIDLDSILQNRLDNGYRNVPGRNYEELTKPLAPFPFKGVVWYQGESDVVRAYAYGDMLKTFIADWRTLLKDDQLPFVVVQIAYGNGKPNEGEPGESRFGEQQQAQQSVDDLPNVSIVTTYDLPRPTDDVHYRDKLPVGRRAALAVLHDVYGMADATPSGPRYESMKVEGDRVRLRFTHVDGGLRTKGEDALGGFSIAGADQKFVWANAKIDGDEVVIWSERVPNPVAVRYGWANAPCGANLINGAGLPALVFRTDDWPWSTKARTEALWGR